MRGFVLAAVLLTLVATVVGSQWDALLMRALDPAVAFDAEATPAAPDYASPAAWTALPHRADAADVVPRGFDGVVQAEAPADVFYVHPTTYVGSAWNGPVDDEALNAQTDRLATLIQATAFNGCCAIYGPRYRQSNGHAFVRPSADGDAALEVAYGDVSRAFEWYLAEHGRGRPFVLAAQSQGSALAARLLRERIAGTPLAGRLVVAYLIGGPIDREPSAGVPVCASPEQTGCLVGWHARGPRFSSSPLDFATSGERVCVNPLTWRDDGAHADAALNEGAVFLHAGDGNALPGFADARCVDGTLRVSRIGDAPRDFMSRILDFLIGPDNHHAIEYQIYYANLRSNAAHRVEAFLRARSSL